MKRGSKAVASTAGWTREFRDKILNALDECGDPLEVAAAHRVEVSQVMKCLARERHIKRRDLAAGDREEYVAELDKRVRVKLLAALDAAANSDDPKDQLRLIELCRKLLEGTGTIVKNTEVPRATVNINVDAEKAQFNLEHVGMVELRERAKLLLEKTHGDTET